MTTINAYSLTFYTTHKTISPLSAAQVQFSISSNIDQMILRQCICLVCEVQLQNFKHFSHFVTANPWKPPRHNSKKWYCVSTFKGSVIETSYTKFSMHNSNLTCKKIIILNTKFDDHLSSFFPLQRSQGSTRTHQQTSGHQWAVRGWRWERGVASRVSTGSEIGAQGQGIHQNRSHSSLVSITTANHIGDCLQGQSKKKLTK